MSDAIKLAADNAWEDFSSGFDLDSNEWLDMGVDETFKAGYLAALRAQPAGWMPIESAPKDGTDILAMYMHIETQIVHNAFWLDDPDAILDSGWWSYDTSEVSRVHLSGFMEPTHWMPLPPPPGQERAQPDHSELVSAARAVVERWDTPLWKDAPATAGFINRLRDALPPAIGETME